ncbi:hypothetical protein J1614_011528 [Plenodomus biglobosus]|nr:hypothetical protein J1614_011528 [Plenodomus biglobosus]
MDYQTFNGHNASFGGGQFNNSPQHSQFDPQARLQQSNPSFPYGGQFPNGQAAAFPAMGGAMGGSVMQPGMPQNPRAAAAALHQQQQLAQQQQQQQQQAGGPYSSAPSQFNGQAIMSPAHQHFAQNRQTASPASNSGQQPFATPQPQQSPRTLPSNGQHQHQHQHSMNAQAPIKSETPQVHTPVKQVTPSPVSPVAQARAQDRMATLLEINSILIKEVCDLQVQGKAGQVGPTPDGKPDGDKPQPSKEYVEYMRRLQANLAYLAQSAEKTHKPGQQLQPGPAIMVAPSSPIELVNLYVKLQDLFPGWKGGTPAQMKQSPGPQQRINSTPQPQQLQSSQQISTPQQQQQKQQQQQQQQQQPPNSAGLQQAWGQNPMGMPQQGMNMSMNTNMNMNPLGNNPAQPKAES